MIMELSSRYPVSKLCKMAGVSRSGFYKWRERMRNPSLHTLTLVNNVKLFKEYHEKYPSHGYRWLNAKIKRDTGQIMSTGYAHKCCKIAGIKSINRGYRYKRAGNPYRLYPNLLMADLDIAGPLECVASDMTAFYVKGVYYELTLYLDLWNNEILAHGLSAKRGDRMTYYDGLNRLLGIKEKYPELDMILHTDQGSVYASKEFNEKLTMHNITHSMSRAGTPTDNSVIESINGWIKSEMFSDLHITGERSITEEVEAYIRFYNEERPAYALNYMTPKEYREMYR